MATIEEILENNFLQVLEKNKTSLFSELSGPSL